MAQPFDSPPRPAAPRPLHIATPSEGRLDNGLRVAVAERHGVPLVSAELVVFTGAEADPPQRAGLASMAAGLLTRGTRKHTAPALAMAAEALGGSLDSAASWNASNIGITVTTPQLGAALALVAEVAMQPTFAPDEIDRLRAESLDELKVAYSQPGRVASLVAQRAVFGDGSYGHPAAGTPASLARITRGDLLAQHAAAFRPDNAVLVFAGDIDLPTAMAMAKSRFGDWRADKSVRFDAARTTGQVRVTASDAASSQPAATATSTDGKGAATAGSATAGALVPTSAVGTPWPQPVIVVDMPGAGQAGVSLAMPAMPADSADRYAGALTNGVLGGGYSSRLNQEIRIKRGLSYGAGSALDLRHDGGVLRVGVQTKNPSAAEVVALVQGELDALIQTPVPADELAARKATLIGNFSRTLETTAGLAGQMASLAVDGLPMSDLTQRVDRLSAVGANDVQAFAARYFDPAHRHVVVAGVNADFGGALKAAAPSVLTVTQQALDLDSALPPARP